MLETLQNFLIELTQKPMYTRPGYVNDKLQVIIKDILTGDYYGSIHNINDVIKYTDYTGLYRHHVIGYINEDFRKLSSLVSDLFIESMNELYPDAV